MSAMQASHVQETRRKETANPFGGALPNPSPGESKELCRLSGLMKRCGEPHRILVKNPEPRIRALAKAQILAEEKRTKTAEPH
jgi:hypothetical protein